MSVNENSYKAAWLMFAVTLVVGIAIGAFFRSESLLPAAEAASQGSAGGPSPVKALAERDALTTAVDDDVARQDHEQQREQRRVEGGYADHGRVMPRAGAA